MGRGINKVIIVGNIGQDPETRTFPDGGSITNISVATSEAWTDKQTGQPQERTEWHRIVFRGRLAEIAAQYLRKGSKVYIEGSLRTTKFQDKQTGHDRYSTDIVAREMQMLDSKPDNQSEPQASQNYQQQQQTTAAKMAQNLQSSSQPIVNKLDRFDDAGDDIPF